MTSPTESGTRAVAICNCLAVRQAARQVTQLYDRHLATVGIRSTQYAILAQLDRQGSCPINTLAAVMVLDRTTLGRALRPLEREGLVHLTPGQDRRKRLLALTESGRQRLAAARPRSQEAQDAFEATFGIPEAAQFRAVTGAVVASLTEKTAARHS